MPKDTKQSAGRAPRAAPPAGFLFGLVPVAILEYVLRFIGDPPDAGRVAHHPLRVKFGAD
jgi:hypothetical protein